MRSNKLLSALTCCVALAQAIQATDNTHIDNHSKTWTIIATTSYPGGNSKFVNRHIPPGGSDVDSYNPVDHVDIQVQVDGAPFNNHFSVPSDASVIAADTPGNQYGVDFWLNDGKGNPVTTNPITKTPWPPLVTIFGPGPPPSASPSPPASPSPSIVPRGALYWNDIRDEGCKSPGYRQMSAHLVGSSSRSNWNADCKATPFSPNNFETLSGDDTSCADIGLFGGERGTWQVYDKACLPYWGSFKDDGCKSKGFRQYSSVLYNIPSGQSWEDWCRHFPADIKGVGSNTQHFFQPDRCVNVVINIWGEFDYPDNSCCSNTGNPGGNHDELAGAGSRKLLVFPPRCDALTGPNLPINAADFLLALLHSARDRAEIQLRNTAIQGLQPPPASAGRNPRTLTRFWERDVFVPGSNNAQFRGNFRVPVFQAFPDSQPPINPSDYLPAQTSPFDATWVPRFTAGQGPLSTPSFTQNNPDGVIDIPTNAFIAIDANGPDVVLTAQLTGCAFVWAYDSVNRVFYAAHINPNPASPNAWARDGQSLANALPMRARFHGTELTVNVYGRGGFGYTATNGNIIAVRNGTGWEVVAQSLGVDRSVPTDVETVDYDNVQ